MSLRRLPLFVTLLAAPALAEPVPGGDVRVERSEPAFDCPAEHDLVRAALALGAAPEGKGSSGTNIVVRFERDVTAYRAVVSATGQKTGERELRTNDADCRRLADAVAVVVAVLLDIVPPDAEGSFEPAAPAAPKPTPAPLAPPPKTPSPAPTREAPPSAPVSPGAAKRAWKVSLRAEGALTFGLLGAAVSPTLGGAAAVARGRFEAALGGFWVVPREVPFDPLLGTSVRLTLALGNADGCYRFASGPTRAWETWICGRFLAGVLGGDGRGFDHHFPHHEPWFGLGPAFALRLPLSRAFSFRVGANATVTLGNHTFRVENYGTAFDSPPLSAGVSLGPEWTIW
jgi:hypothetical protein